MDTPYPLGRIPSAPDARDYPMRAFLTMAADDPWSIHDLDQTLGDLLHEGKLATWGQVRAMWKFLKTVKNRPTPPAPITKRMWEVKVVLDQGQTPRCTGYATAGWGNCEPIEDAYTNADGDRFYAAAKKIDGNDEDGSSIRSVIKGAQGFGIVQSYYFAETLQDVKDWVLNHGSVIMGTNWYSGMFYPTAAGLVTVSGKIAGGHAWLIIGYDSDLDIFTCLNSWGTGWADKGRFYVDGPSMERLLSEEGEACAAIEIAV